ncbi:MAG: alpha-amylase family glycosyl hydrolase [Ardenticatenia bacterium]|nr:alpha-amylase family glycosyl hydrolase [Ardenticatenia bacterium]
MATAVPGAPPFEDNDSNAWSSSGPITRLTPSLFNARLLSMWEDYPPMAFKAMMNLEGSHDTNRIRFLLRKVNNDDDATAVQRMKEWWIFSFTYPGAPTLYYGDEIGLNHDGVWYNNTWEDDPYNRVPFPWPDASGSTYGYDSTAQAAGLLDHARTMAGIRHSYRALQDGDVRHAVVLDDANWLYGFARLYDDGTTTQVALIVLNRDNAGHSTTIGGLSGAPYNLSDGTVLVDALNGGTYTVSGGSVTVNVPSNWGVVLLEQAKLDAPQAPSGRTAQVSGGVNVTFSSVFTDTAGGFEVVAAYHVYRDADPAFTPDSSTLIATVVPDTYGGYRLSYQANPAMTLTFDPATDTITLYDPDGTGAHYYALASENHVGVSTVAGPSPQPCNWTAWRAMWWESAGSPRSSGGL